MNDSECTKGQVCVRTTQTMIIAPVHVLAKATQVTNRKAPLYSLKVSEHTTDHERTTRQNEVRFEKYIVLAPTHMITKAI